MPQLSRRTADLHPSPIREILSVIDRPGMISFAGGLPAAATFPALDLASLAPSHLQYGASEGEPALRARVAEDLAGHGLAVSPEQVLILSGSQQGIDLVAKLFIDPGTPVAVESPTYLAALQVFRFFGARFQPLNPAAPRGALQNRPAFVYVNPTFQNPTGSCYSHAERTALAWACDATGVPVFEDDPYRDLAYDECDREPICARVQRTSWVYQGSFSKSLAPGLRLGYLACSKDLLPYLVRLKQAADLHSNRLGQALVLAALNAPERATRLASLRTFYRARRDAFDDALHRHFDDLATWERPPGGLFYWLRLAHARLDTTRLLSDALAENVAFMPGESFFATPTEAYASMRLNFSHADPALAEHGLATLARLLRSQRDTPRARAPASP
ncbi:MAG: PLP-dependent aminotransferase family protein [Gammaproteobacteria bacterium]